MMLGTKHGMVTKQILVVYCVITFSAATANALQFSLWQDR